MALMNSNLPVVILAGGRGTRLGGLTEEVPKPLIRVGHLPIIAHIMKLWHNAGHREFIIAGGYKCTEFTREFTHKGWKDIVLPGSTCVPVDTGVETGTGGRLLRLKTLLANRGFALSYGDGLTNYPLENLVNAHMNFTGTSSMLVVHPNSQFGHVQFDESNLVSGFSEKPRLDSWINAGFFVFNPQIFDYIKEKTSVLEVDVLPKLVNIHGLQVVKCEDWWQCMDTPKDVKTLNSLWNGGKAPWIK